ncbi:MAG: nicotinate (nicotinamide) nucleotide adenylyltransferase, partial [Deltaproteobacteria bacterium]|nr:nicotinate (nicotinamide) nucleotide adenylyltransferase [Deltaproteobacteria bacterium]
MKRLGILGGTFDPIHLGHLRTAVEIGQALNFEKIYVIPSASPPHKTEEPIAPFRQRLEMARLGAGDSPLLEATDLEGRRPGPSYSIETLREFQMIFKGDFELFFIMGSDAFLEIKSWREYPALFEYANFVIVKRSGVASHRLEDLLLSLEPPIKKDREGDVYTTKAGKKLIFMETAVMDISSTRIRKMVSEGKSIRFLVPE